MLLSLPLPAADASVRCPSDGSANGLVGDQALLDRVFSSLDTGAAAGGFSRTRD